MQGEAITSSLRHGASNRAKGSQAEGQDSKGKKDQLFVAVSLTLYIWYISHKIKVEAVKNISN